MGGTGDRGGERERGGVFGVSPGVSGGGVRWGKIQGGVYNYISRRKKKEKKKTLKQNYSLFDNSESVKEKEEQLRH